MSNKYVEYEAWRALIQSGDIVYPKAESDKVLFPTLKNCAWMVNRGQPHLWNDDNKKHYPNYINLKNQEYSINSMGYRGKELGEHPSDILVAGCSQTWGIGVPDGYIWPDILREKTNLSVDNIGYSAKSIAGIVQLIFCYFREIGIPKHLFVVFPDQFRMLFPTTNNFMHMQFGDDELYEQPIMANTGLNQSRFLYEKPKYAAAPYFLEEMMTEEVTVWQAVSYIQMLEDYCNAAGVNLKYGGWDPFLTEMMNTISNQNNFYKNYIDLDSLSWVIDGRKDQKYGPDPDCHKELQDEENILFWDHANDYYFRDYKVAHMGVHRHIHVAEIFEKEVLNNV